MTMRVPCWLGCIACIAAGCAAAAETPVAEQALTRATVLKALRPAVRELLREVEEQTGVEVVFEALPRTSPVLAQFWFNPHTNTPTVSLRAGWEDVDVAHELLHMKLDLVDGFHVLAWRDVPRTKEVEAAFARVRTYVDDELVHTLLVKGGHKLDGEVLRPPLFDSLYTNATRLLNEGRAHRDDGMAHLDSVGHGELCRAAFLVQAELIVERHGTRLTPEHLQLAKQFIATFRAHRAKEAEKADKVLALFRKYDVMTIAGHESILREWSQLEGLDKYIGISAYKKQDGKYILPWP